MTFKEYYGEPFRADLRAYLASYPSPHYGESEAIIQPRTLSIENPVIRAWKPERIDLFATALFFTVLVDQVCYTHFRGSYSRFQALTLYPKFRCDCPGGCRYHAQPSFIFKAIGSSLAPNLRWLGRARLRDDAIEVMHAEVLEFFNVHLKEVDGEQFWRRCADEMPLKGRLK